MSAIEPELNDMFTGAAGARRERERLDDDSAGPDVSDSTNAHGPEPLDESALHGPAGEFVKIVEPHTEADVVALLIQFLVAVGNIFGSGVYRIADGASHHLNLFAVLVGNTSHGRKGSSWAQVKRLLRLVEPVWLDDHLQSGLSSGEGLIWAVRDPIERREAVKENGKFTGEYETYESDPGVADKRLLVLEQEFSSVLKVCDRAGNTLSPTIRQAWDSGDLRTMTKNSPAKATGAHISIVGHITQDELLRGLDSTEAANGFANRFLWFAVKRSKLLPFGGDLQHESLASLVVTLRCVLEWCKQPHELAFSKEASNAWICAYGDLSAGRPGLLGSVLGRAEAQVLRLACLYAALDCSPVIEIAHLKAALALWEYSERSAEYVFGDRMGDPVADTILCALRANSGGLTRTEIRDLFSRNLSADRIERALEDLRKANLAQPEKFLTDGRAGERWRASSTT
jgi:Protein of unknown function (DUF3987)